MDVTNTNLLSIKHSPENTKSVSLELELEPEPQSSEKEPDTPVELDFNLSEDEVCELTKILLA